MKNLSRVRNCSLINQLPALVVLIFLFFPFFIQANNPLDVVINEIAWMGTVLSYNDEWIELYNNTEQSLNLESWVLKAGDGSPKINLTGSIPANGFYLLERTDDNTVPNIPADQIYTGILENKGEYLELYDNLGNLIDSINGSSGWFGGDKSTKQTMERKDPRLPGNHSDNWGTSQKPGGTPKAKNSLAKEVPPKPEVKLLPEVESFEEFEKTESSEKGLAAAAEPLRQGYLDRKTPKSLSLFLIALSLAIFSGIIILILKRKLINIQK